MKNQKHPKLIALVFLCVLTCRCASQGGQDQSEEPVDGDALDGQQQENASLNGQTQGGQAQQGESMNNAVGGNNFSGANNFSNSNVAAQNPAANSYSNPFTNPASNPMSVPLNQSAPINGAANIGNALPMNNASKVNSATPPSNTAATDTSVALPTASTPATPAAATVNWDKMKASPFANAQMNWPGRGKVKYITRKATRHASPDGPVVGEFNQGNHPLVYQNGNWVELSNGTFVKGNATSDHPVGYNRSSGAGTLAH